MEPRLALDVHLIRSASDPRRLRQVKRSRPPRCCTRNPTRRWPRQPRHRPRLPLLRWQLRRRRSTMRRSRAHRGRPVRAVAFGSARSPASETRSQSAPNVRPERRHAATGGRARTASSRSRRRERSPSPNGTARRSGPRGGPNRRPQMDLVGGRPPRRRMIESTSKPSSACGADRGWCLPSSRSCERRRGCSRPDATLNCSSTRNADPGHDRCRSAIRCRPVRLVRQRRRR
jgi:hypothetical protein